MQRELDNIKIDIVSIVKFIFYDLNKLVVFQIDVLLKGFGVVFIKMVNLNVF